MLSASDLAAIRAEQATFLPDTCTIQRPVIGYNSIGEGTVGWSTLGTVIPCRVRPDNLQVIVQLLGGVPFTQDRYIITFVYNQDCEPGDRILQDGHVYEVVHTEQEESWKTAVRANVRKVE